MRNGELNDMKEKTNERTLNIRRKHRKGQAISVGYVEIIGISLIVLLILFIIFFGSDIWAAIEKLITGAFG